MTTVRSEQVETVYRLALRAILTSTIVALIVFYVFWGVLSPVFMTGWFTAYIVITLVRAAIAFRYFNVAACKEHAELCFCIGSIAISLTWSVLIYQFDTAWSAEHQVLLFLAAWGVVANIGIYSALISVMLSYSLPILLTSIWVLFIQEEPVYRFTSCIVTVLGLGLLYQGLRLGGITSELVKAQQEALSAFKQLEALAEVDPLTKLKNRGALERYLADAWNAATPAKQPISVLMIDVDYFKRYNDEYGHIEGDACLVKIAGIIRDSVPEGEGFVGRYGGEEFIVVLPGASNHEAFTIASRIKGGIEGENIPHSGSLVASRITVSVGIDSITPDSDSSESWLRLIGKADENLYTAKKNGRNQIVG